MIKSLWLPYLRWRHSKGYGVHSPFAYRFVTDVLRPGRYGYYAYWSVFNILKPEEERDSKKIRLIQFTIRLAIFINASRILVAGKDQRFAKVAAKALKLPVIDAKALNNEKPSNGDLLILTSDDDDESLVRKAIDANIAIFAINPSAGVRKILDAPIKRGLALRGKKKFILVPRQDMHYVDYDMKL